MDARTAQKMFEENARLFGSPPRSKPEQHNLYMGLANLAGELQSLRRELYDLRQAIDRLGRR